jgi:DNA topoisomerase I
LAPQLWRDSDPAEASTPTLAGAKRLLSELASRLGNTVAACRKAYVHPRVLALIAGEAKTTLKAATARRAGLSPAERGLIAFLKTRG